MTILQSTDNATDNANVIGRSHADATADLALSYLGNCTFDESEISALSDLDDVAICQRM